MKILFFRYGSICEPDVISCFEAAGLSVEQERSDGKSVGTASSRLAETISARLLNDRFLFVFTINFFPAVSEVCHVHRVPYVCWTVDSPVMELFSASLKNDCNYVFLFDRAQYECFRHENPGHIFHLPLAANVSRWDNTIRSAPSATKQRYASDVSFVGSLYREYNIRSRFADLADHTQGYFDGLTESQMRVYGFNFLEDALTQQVLDDVRRTVPEVETLLFNGGDRALRYYVAHILIGYDLAEKERETLLNALAKLCPVDLYTRSDPDALSGIRVRGAANSLTEMPLVFHESRVNLNITIRPIQTGLPQRIFDICGCGGFLMTNYQAELGELYEPGVEVEYFTSREELLDKTAYYLAHEDARQTIARKGYERTVSSHTHAHRINEMIRQVMSAL